MYTHTRTKPSKTKGCKFGGAWRMSILGHFMDEFANVNVCIHTLYMEFVYIYIHIRKLIHKVSLNAHPSSPSKFTPFCFGGFSSCMSIYTFRFANSFVKCPRMRVLISTTCSCIQLHGMRCSCIQLHSATCSCVQLHGMSV